MTEVIVATTSRGRNLRPFVDSYDAFPNSWNLHDIVRPGQKLSVLFLETKKKILQIRRKNRHAFIFVVFVGGLIDLTTKTIDKSRNMVDVCYEGTDKALALQRCLHSVHTSLDSMAVHHKFAHVVPMHLSKYRDWLVSKKGLSPSSTTAEELAEQQAQLESDILEVNAIISSINDSSELSHVRWDKDLVNSSLKVRGKFKQNVVRIKRISYNKLYDGCHPSYKLSCSWMKRLIDGIIYDIQHINPYGFDDNDDENMGNSWDFKRI